MKSVMAGIWGSHDPVGGDPVFAGGEHSNGGQELLIGNINILVDNGGIKIMSIQFLHLGGFFCTLCIVLILNGRRGRGG